MSEKERQDFMQVLEYYYISNYENLLKQIKRKAGSEYNAEDILQEAFTRAIECWDSYDHNRPIAGWMNGIIYNALSDFKRVEAKQGMVTEEEGTINIQDQVEESESLDRLRGILEKKLENKERPAKDILYLYFSLQYTPREIRMVLNVPVKTIRQVIWRFKKDAMKGYGED